MLLPSPPLRERSKISTIRVTRKLLLLKTASGFLGIVCFPPPEEPHFIVGFQDYLATKFVDLKVEPSFVPSSNFILVNLINKKVALV